MRIGRWAHRREHIGSENHGDPRIPATRPQTHRRAASHSIGAGQAVDLLAVMRKMADLLLQQPAAKRRKLLRLVLESSGWKGGELRMCFRERFPQLRLSNRASQPRKQIRWR